jgi:prepilin peptidase CpaA
LLLVVWFVTAVTAVVAAYDIRFFRIPNLATFSLSFTALFYHAMTAGFSGLGDSFTGLLVGGVLLIPFFLLGAMGAGDVKLLASIGAWLGAQNAFSVFVIAGIASGITTVIVYAQQRRLGKLPLVVRTLALDVVSLGRHNGGVQAAVEQPDRRRAVVPFAAMLFVGVLAVALRASGIV